MLGLFYHYNCSINCKNDGGIFPSRRRLVKKKILETVTSHLNCNVLSWQGRCVWHNPIEKPEDDFEEEEEEEEREDVEEPKPESGPQLLTSIAEDERKWNYQRFACKIDCFFYNTVYQTCKGVLCHICKHWEEKRGFFFTAFKVFGKCCVLSLSSVSSLFVQLSAWNIYHSVKYLLG